MDRIMAPEKMTIKLVKVKYLTSRKGLTFSSVDWRVLAIGNKNPANKNDDALWLIFFFFVSFFEIFAGFLDVSFYLLKSALSLSNRSSHLVATRKAKEGE